VDKLLKPRFGQGMAMHWLGDLLNKLRVGLSIRAWVMLSAAAAIVLPAWWMGAVAHADWRWLIGVQAGCALLALWAVLHWRLRRPLDQLARQAGALTEPGPSLPPPAVNDELGELSQQLHGAHDHIASLMGALAAGNTELRRQAMADPLTGLPNRRLFQELFGHARAIAERQQHPMALLFIDLDHFKQVNDSLGHAAGDELLLCISQRLRDALRQSDLLCRLSGDEFAILMTPVSAPLDITRGALRLIRAVEAPVPIGTAGEAAQVSASIGVASYPRDGSTLEALLQCADQAMYSAKAEGRSRFAVYQTPPASAAPPPPDDIGAALQRGDFRLDYLVTLDARDGMVMGAEGLLRWLHPSQGLLLPVRFLGRADASGQARALHQYTLELACAQLARARADHQSPTQVMVNVSASQARDLDWTADVASALQHHQLPAGMLAVELSESCLMANAEAMQSQVDALRALGVALWIDDFGAGPMSLLRLQQLRPAGLKIDAMFVRSVLTDARSQAMVRGLVQLAQQLGMALVAKGVETADQREWLISLGCPVQQGFLYGAPGPLVPSVSAPWPLGPPASASATAQLAAMGQAAHQASTAA
jgi:diguanylate cyclase (GGDEF)-like protein